MPPRLFSRHTFTTGTSDTEERLFLSDRKVYTFRTLPDNQTWEVREGDTLYTVAGALYRGIPRPAGLWWVIADFQPTPVHDPTLKLDNGRVLFAPSRRVVTEEILAEARRLESQV